MNVLYLKTKDGIMLKDIPENHILFEVIKLESGRFKFQKEELKFVIDRAKEIDEDNPWVGIKDKKHEELMGSIFTSQEKAEAEVFKCNKLLFTSKISNYKETYKQALRIISDFTDDELFNFVEQHKAKEDATK